MINPWRRLPYEAPYVLPSDRGIIDDYNSIYIDKPDVVIQTQLAPEPFVGTPNGVVYTLGLNPGYSPEDDRWHREPRFMEAIQRNLAHQESEYPFYLIDPLHSESPGYRWWTKRLRRLIEDVGQQLLANRLFCVELFPYHSHRYKPVPKSISETRNVPSSAYARDLVQTAIRDEKPVIVMRALKRWIRLVPELTNYPHLHQLRNPRGVYLSPKNLNGYEAICSRLVS